MFFKTTDQLYNFTDLHKIPLKKKISKAAHDEEENSTTESLDSMNRVSLDSK